MLSQPVLLRQLPRLVLFSKSHPPRLLWKLFVSRYPIASRGSTPIDRTAKTYPFLALFSFNSLIIGLGGFRPLKIEKIQDSNGNDLDLSYLVSDVFSDKLEDNLNSIVRVLQKSTLRESSIPPESSLRPQFPRKRRRLGTVTEVNGNTSQRLAPSPHSSERGGIRERPPKRPRINDYVVQDSMDDQEEGEERWGNGTCHDNRFGAGHDGSEMVEVAATQQSRQLSPSLGNRTPSPEIAITGTVEHPDQAPFIEVKEEDKEQAGEIQGIHCSSPRLPREPGSAEPDHHSSPTLPPNPARGVDTGANGIRRSIYDIPTSSSSEDEPSLPVSSRSGGRQRNCNPSQSPTFRKKRAEEARLAAEKAERERAKEQAAAREKAAKAAEARVKAEEAEKERLDKEKAEAGRRQKETGEAELQEQKRTAAEKLEKQRGEEERKRREETEHEARISAEKAEKEKLERERLEKAEQQRLVKEKREQERIVKEKAKQEEAERERLEKEHIQQEKEDALNEKKEKVRKQKLARAAERRVQRAEKLEREKAEKLERERAEKAEKTERLKREKAEKAQRVAREKAEKAEKLEREKAEKLEREKAEEARKQAEHEENNRLAKEAKKQAKERAKGPALNSSGKETPSSQSLPQSSQVLMADSESPVPTPNSTLKRSNLKAKIPEGSRKRSSVSFAEDLTEISSPLPTGKKDTLAPVLGSKVTPILPPGYGANKLIAEAVVMRAPAEARPPTKKTKLAVLPPKPTTAKKISPQPSLVPARASLRGRKTKEHALKPKPTLGSDSESEGSTDGDSGESGEEESDSGEEEEETKPSSKSSVFKSTARVKSAKNASPLMTLKPSSTAANSLKTPPSTQQSTQRSSRPSPHSARKTPISAPPTPAMETNSEAGSQEETGSASDSDFGPAPKTTPTATSTKTSKPKATKPSPSLQPYRSLTDLEKMPVPDVHDVHSSQPPNSSTLPPPSGTVRGAHDEDDDSSEESSESGGSSDDEEEVAGKRVINSAKKAATAPAKKGGFLSNFWGRKEK